MVKRRGITGLVYRRYGWLGMELMLAQKQNELKEHIQELQDCVAYIDFKQNFYKDVLETSRERLGLCGWSSD